MFTKLVVIAAVAALTVAVEYPAGVNPAICPNYPFCDMKLTAWYAPDGTPVPEWVRDPSILPVGPLGRVPVSPYPYTWLAPQPQQPAARYPANFDAARCPNYPYCW